MVSNDSKQISGLGDFDPNAFPMDVFNLTGTTADSERLISLKAPWKFDGESSNYPISGYIAGRGWWIKFANGTLIQHYVATTNTNGTSGSGKPQTYFGVVNPWTFPIQFLATEGHTIVTGTLLGADATFDGASGYVAAASSSSIKIVVYASFAGPYSVMCNAIGRWKA